MICARSFLDAPRASKHLIKRSSETVGSPDSIFATRDWLDRTIFARSVCVIWRRRRLFFRPAANLSLSSIYASSSGERARNSRVLPTLHPLDSSRFRFSSRIVILPKPPSSNFDHRLRRCLRLLLEDFCDNHRVRVDPIHDAPRRIDIHDSQFMASRSDAGYRSRVRHAESLAFLESPQLESGLKPGLLGERRRLYLAVQPDKRFVSRFHEMTPYAHSDIMSTRTRSSQPDQRLHKDRNQTGSGLNYQLFFDPA